MSMTIPAIRIVYSDGTTDDVMLTAGAQGEAEDKAVREGWNLGGTRHNLYAVYWQLRHDRRTTLPFEAWCANVVTATQTTMKVGDDPFDGAQAEPAN